MRNSEYKVLEYKKSEYLFNEEDIMCRKHPDSVLNMFCFTDNILICDICFTDDYSFSETTSTSSCYFGGFMGGKGFNSGHKMHSVKSKEFILN